MFSKSLSRSLSRRFARSASSLASSSSFSVPTEGAAAFTRYPTAKVSQLENGLRVVTETLPSPTVTVSVHLDAGSRYESADNNGVAHFCEHMFFKGTSRRSRVQLEKEVEQLGGSLDAHTSREQTAFVSTVPRANLNNAMDILSDMLLHSKFDEAAVNQEKGTILREAQEVNKDMNEVLFDRLHETAYRGVALARPILGSEENIQKFTSKDLRQWVDNFFIGPRAVLSVAGPVDHAQVVEQAKKLFGSMRSSPASPVVPADPAVFLGSEIRVRFDSMPEAHVAIAFPTAGHNDPDHLPLLVIQNLIGSYDRHATGAQHHSSPMIRDVAKEHLASSVSPFNTIYSDTGLFGVSFVGNKYSLNDLAYCVTRELTGLSYGVCADRLAEAKQALIHQFISQYDSSRFVAEDLGRQFLQHNRRIHPSEFVARINSVDANAVKSAATRFFYDRDFALAAIGPTWELPDYNWIRRRTYWVRF